MKGRGFTLIELLVVISILMVILAFGMARFTQFNRRERIKQTALSLKANLRLAQTKAISSEKPTSGCTTYSGIRVTFTQNTYSFHPECSPEGVLTATSTVTFSDPIVFSTIPAAFSFLTLTNTTSNTASELFTLSNGQDIYRLELLQNGGVNDVGFQ